MQDAMFNTADPHVLVQGWPAPYTPWVVKLLDYRNGRSATGTVVNQDWVFTSRHFVDQQDAVRFVFGETTAHDSNRLTSSSIEFDELVLGEGDVVALHVTRRSRDVLADRAAPIDWDYNPATHIGDTTVTYGFGDSGWIRDEAELRQATGRITMVGTDSDYPGGMVVADRLVAGTTEGGDSGGPVGVRVPPVNQNDTGFRVVGVHGGRMDQRSTTMGWIPLRHERRLWQIVTNRPTQIAIVENANSTECTFTPSSSNA